MKNFFSIIALLLFFSLTINTNSFAQSQTECNAKLTQLKKACAKIDPTSENEIMVINTMDEIFRLPLKALGASSYGIVGDLLDELFDIASDVKLRVCTSKTCKRAKEIKEELKKEIKKRAKK
jgi:hypothetical protein